MILMTLIVDWYCATDPFFFPSASFHLYLVLDGNVLKNRTLLLFFE